MNKGVDLVHSKIKSIFKDAKSDDESKTISYKDFTINVCSDEHFKLNKKLNKYTILIESDFKNPCEVLDVLVNYIVKFIHKNMSLQSYHWFQFTNDSSMFIYHVTPENEIVSFEHIFKNNYQGSKYQTALTICGGVKTKKEFDDGEDLLDSI